MTGVLTPEPVFLNRDPIQLPAEVVSESRPLLHCLRNLALGNGAGTGMISLTCNHASVAQPWLTREQVQTVIRE